MISWKVLTKDLNDKEAVTVRAATPDALAFFYQHTHHVPRTK
ncbi:hypothetical protein KEM60_01642 [Austwickia sp. TVS 96-490-7B]|nr:hypothetical protein [Austwickia sp. TVS 96-490-7B]MBW3085442.1 hypothetical protein [Austwickia sp. TVS 96-490-7B]